MKICVNCRHFMNQGPIWYSQFCAASPLPTGIDPVSGTITARSTNDLGMVHPTEHKYDFARNVNTQGRCVKYDAA